MTYFTIIRRSLIAISALALSLILWLNGSFWYDAYLQRTDASELLQSIRLDDTLFKLSRDLSKERNLIHMMLNDTSAEIAVKQSALIELQDISHVLNSQLLEDIAIAMNTPSMVSRLTFEPAIVEDQIKSISIQWQSLKLARESILAQLALPPVNRDADLLQRIFDQYSTFVDTTQQLRRKLHITPRRNELSIENLQTLRATIWNFGEAIAREASLISGLMVIGEQATSKHISLIESFHSQELSNWRDLNDYVQHQGSNTDLVHSISRIEEQYFNEYVKLRNKILADLKTSKTTPVWLDQWLFVVNRINSQLDALDNKISIEVRTIGQDVEAHGVRRLIIDTTIVAICLLIGAAVIAVLNRIQHMATHDALTGLPNRIRFENLLKTALSGTNEHRVGLMIIDLDGFKQVNDRLGHSYGDQLLKQVADRLLDNSANDVTIARLGGDEFVVVNILRHSDQTLTDSAKIYVSILAREFDIEGKSVSIGASIGLCLSSDQIFTPEQLLKNADIAMYHAKAQGKNCFQMYDRAVCDEYQSRIQLELDLKQAIKEKQFKLQYQPQVNVRTHKVDGVEALIRWEHPEKGMIAPNKFIQIAEETNLISAIGDWVIDGACRQISIWSKNDLTKIKVAVNVSTSQFSRHGFVEFVETTCTKYNVDPRFLELEITESALSENIERVIETFNQLRALHIEIAIDDFGTGYSSLSYLQDLPVDTIKIDKSFIDRLNKQSDSSIAKTIVALAKACGLKTVAEGVETGCQREQITDLECDYIQGYFYSKPLNAAEIPQKISEINSPISNKAA